MTPTLPLTVTDVQRVSAVLWGVRVAMADGTVLTYYVPDTLATVEAVRISALAMAVLSDPDRPPATAPHRKHRRYDPRTAT